MEITEVTDSAGFRGLRHEWNALADCCANPLLYSRHEWVWASWRNYGDGRAPIIVCMRDNGKLKAVFAWLVTEFRLGRLVSYRVAMPLGQAVAMCQDSIISRGFEHKAVTAMVAHAQQAHPEWEALILRRVHPESIWVSMARRKDLGGKSWLWEDRMRIAYGLLPGTWEDLMGGFGRDLRRNLKRYSRKLEGLGQVETHVLTEQSDILAAWPGFASLHENHWGMEQLQEIGYNRYKPFVEELIRELSSSDLLKLVLITLDGEPVAGLFCLDYNDTSHFLILSRDSRYHDLHLGKLIHAAALRHAVGRGLARCDLGTAEYGYKWQFVPYAHHTYGLMVPRDNGFKSHLLALAERNES